MCFALFLITYFTWDLLWVLNLMTTELLLIPENCQVLYPNYHLSTIFSFFPSILGNNSPYASRVYCLTSLETLGCILGLFL